MLRRCDAGRYDADMALSKLGLARRRLQALLIPLGCAYLGYKMLKAKFEGIAPVGAVLILGVGILVAIYIYPSKDPDPRHETRRKTQEAPGALRLSPRDPCNGGRAGLLPLPAPADNAAMEAEPPKTDLPKRERRWFQFGLRTLIELGSRIIHCASIEVEYRRSADSDGILNADADRLRPLTFLG
jgi:hypothetical protein